jgi:hypothetical protein
MPHPRYRSHEIVERGQALYEQLRAQVEPGNIGKFRVIDIETGEYEIDRDELAALKRVKAKRPDGPRYLLRIGYRGFLTLPLPEIARLQFPYEGTMRVVLGNGQPVELDMFKPCAILSRQQEE